MTKSQVWSAVGAVATVVSMLCAALEPQVKLLPEKYSWVSLAVGILGTVAGVFVVAFNQSLSSQHVSLPVDTARAVLPAGVKREIGMIGEE
jgi:hypothetical protein